MIRVPKLDATNKIPAPNMGAGIASITSVLHGDRIWRPIGGTLRTSVRIIKNIETQLVQPYIWSRVIWNTKLYDTNNEFSLANNRFVATNTGKLFIDLILTWAHQATPSTFKIAIFKNGIVLKMAIFADSSTQNCTASLVIIENTVVGDFYEAFVYSETDKTLSNSSLSAMFNFEVFI